MYVIFILHNYCEIVCDVKFSTHLRMSWKAGCWSRAFAAGRSLGVLSRHFSIRLRTSLWMFLGTSSKGAGLVAICNTGHLIYQSVSSDSLYYQTICIIRQSVIQDIYTTDSVSSDNLYHQTIFNTEHFIPICIIRQSVSSDNL